MKIHVSNKSENDHYTTINNALDICNDGDELIIEEGKYIESFYIKKKIKIIGNGNVDIFCENKSLEDTCFISETTSLENLTIRSSSGNALHIYACTDVHIKNCKFITLNDRCVTITGSSYFVFDKCKFSSPSTTFFYTDFFDNGGLIKNSNIESIDKYAIKVDKNSVLNIQNSDISSKFCNCLCISDEAILNIKNCNLSSKDGMKNTKLFTIDFMKIQSP